MDVDWIKEFVMLSRTVQDGTELVEAIPIRPSVYLKAPIFWASAPDGNFNIILYPIGFYGGYITLYGP